MALLIDTFNLDSGNYRTRRIIHDQMPPADLHSLEVAGQDGEKLISSSFRPKKITLEGIIKGNTAALLDTNIDTFKQNVSGNERNLDIDYRGTTRRYKVSSSSITITRDFFHRTFAPFSIEFEVLNPPFGLATSATETLSAVAIADDSYTQTITFDGTAEPKPEIGFVFDTANGINRLQFKNLTNNRQTDILMTSTASNIQNSDQLIINTENMTIKRNNYNETYEGIFPEFEVGVNEIEVQFLKAGTINQQQISPEGGNFSIYQNLYRAQSFKPSANITVPKIDIFIGKATNLSSNLTIEIQTDSSNNPSGTIVTNGSTTILSSDAPFEDESTWVSAIFSPSVSLTSGVTYWLILKSPGSSSSDNWRWWDDTGNLYLDGTSSTSTNGGLTWVHNLNLDFTFKIYTSSAVPHSVDLEINDTPRYL